MQVVRGIYRYPVKGLSPQPVSGVTLEPDKPFPFDRVFALARPGAGIDPRDPKWAKKGLFVMLMLEESLASVRTDVDPETMTLTVTEIDGETSGGIGGGIGAGAEALVADLTTDAGRESVERFVARLAPSLQGVPKLADSRGGHFMDKPDAAVSLINLATLRSLERDRGVAMNPLRFRANFYVDGFAPWEEFDWVGSDIRLGDAVCRVDRRNGRCGAINVNPATGQRDMEIPARLRATFRHNDLGVYLMVRQGGKVVLGDPVAAPKLGQGAEVARPAAPPPNADDEGRARYICRNCYYIYHKGRGTAETSFAALDDGWRRPDCGGEKSGFRGYIAMCVACRAATRSGDDPRFAKSRALTSL